MAVLARILVGGGIQAEPAAPGRGELLAESPASTRAMRAARWRRRPPDWAARSCSSMAAAASSCSGAGGRALGRWRVSSARDRPRRKRW
jgi:hypothetical protein